MYFVFKELYECNKVSYKLSTNLVTLLRDLGNTIYIIGSSVWISKTVSKHTQGGIAEWLHSRLMIWRSWVRVSLGLIGKKFEFEFGQLDRGRLGSMMSGLCLTTTRVRCYLSLIIDTVWYWLLGLSEEVNIWTNWTSIKPGSPGV